MLGTINGSLLTVSRIPFAMAEAGQLPPSLARLHPVYRTPAISIIVSSLVVLVLTLTSTFTYVVTISTVARLLVFAVTCAALPVLRASPPIPLPPGEGSPSVEDRVVPGPLFRLYGGQWIAGAALVLIAWLLASTSWRETRDVLLAAVVGLVLFRGWRSVKSVDIGRDVV
jgi:amino acid transporter